VPTGGSGPGSYAMHCDTPGSRPPRHARGGLARSHDAYALPASGPAILSAPRTPCAGRDTLAARGASFPDGRGSLRAPVVRCPDPPSSLFSGARTGPLAAPARDRSPRRRGSPHHSSPVRAPRAYCTAASPFRDDPLAGFTKPCGVYVTLRHLRGASARSRGRRQASAAADKLPRPSSPASIGPRGSCSTSSGSRAEPAAAASARRGAPRGSRARSGRTPPRVCPEPELHLKTPDPGTGASLMAPPGWAGGASSATSHLSPISCPEISRPAETVGGRSSPSTRYR
jgi:hypothetical protein